MTSNEFYGKINRRFDKREKELVALGYKRETLSAYNLALYVKQRHGKTHVVQPASLHHACAYAWNDIMEDCRRFCGVETSEVK